MPWCPQCDETFPEGPACPRCRSPLVEGGGGPGAEELQGSVGLPQLKVPRRVRRAFGRISQPPAPSKQALAFAVSVVLIAGGFALGRMSTIPSDVPVVRAPPPGPPLGLPVRGFVDYVARVPGGGRAVADLAVERISLESGEPGSLARFSSPFGSVQAGREGTGVASHGASVAVVLTGPQGRSLVGAFPPTRPPVLWLDGRGAAWEAPDVLLVLGGAGVQRWSFAPDRIATDLLPGTWVGVLQAPDGAVLEEAGPDARHLSLVTPEGLRAALVLPPGAGTLAVGPGGGRALVEVEGRAVIWDGGRAVPLQLEPGYRVYGAAFAADGEKVAATVRDARSGSRPSPLQLAVAQVSDGRVYLRNLTSWDGDEACAAVPAWVRWDGPGGERRHWVLVAPNDGNIYAHEVGTASVVRLRADPGVGCGIAWSA